MEEEIIITESDAVHPILLIPKKCTMLKTNCEASDNIFIYLNIKSRDTEGNETPIYTGFCNVKLLDNNLHDYDNSTQVSDFSYNPIPIVVPEAHNQGISDHQSQVWIDPARSPYVYNNYGGIESQEQYSLYQTHSGHITVQQHNTYITQNVYNYNEAVQYSAVEEFEHKKFRKIYLSDANQQIAIDSTLDEEFECGVFLSQLPEEIMNENENRAREELKYIDMDSENDALKQLMSSDIQSLSKKQRTILYLGHDSQYGQTIQNIAVNNPTAKCVDSGVDNEVFIDSMERITKRYQCDTCKRIFDQIAAFKRHIRCDHERRSPPPPPPPAAYACPECGKALKSQRKLELHRLGHGDPDVECATCRKVFATKFTLRNHRRVHQRRHRCARCGREFGAARELAAHGRRDHKGDANPDVEVSPAEPARGEAPSPGALVVDAEEDAVGGADGGAPLRDVREAEAVIAKVMKNNIFLLHSQKARRHKNKKVCDVCCKRFDRVGDLKRHLIEHVIRSTLAKTPVNANGTLTIRCEVCRAESFSRVDRYKEHLREHAKLTLYKCIFCDKSFSDSSNFSKHKKVHGAAYLQCDLCQRKFNSKKTIARHMEYHRRHAPVGCPLCDKAFHFPSALRKHAKYAHAREAARTRCGFCPQYFRALKDKWDHEWAQHRVRKMIVDCLVCGAKFRKYTELKRHCKRAHDMAIPPAKSLLRAAS